MKTIHAVIPAIIALIGCLTSGCVTHTTVKDEPRQGVRFSSAEAAQTFYDAYLYAASPKGHGSVTLSVPTPYWHRTVSTDNIHFNSAVRIADSNHDGIISEEEARAFAAQKHTGKLALSR
jgi:hypothetical protein